MKKILTRPLTLSWSTICGALIVAAGALCGTAPQAHAVTYYAVADGEWTTSTTWNTAPDGTGTFGVPPADASTTLLQLNNEIDLTFSTGATLDYGSAGFRHGFASSVSFTSGSINFLNINGQNSATFTVDGATVTADAALGNSPSYIVTSGLFDISGNLVIRRASSVGGSGQMLSGSLEFQSNAGLSLSGILRTDNSSIDFNAGTSVIDFVEGEDGIFMVATALDPETYFTSALFDGHLSKSGSEMWVYGQETISSQLYATVTAVTVPEPSSAAMALVGGAVMMLAKRRRATRG